MKSPYNLVLHKQSLLRYTMIWILCVGALSLISFFFFDQPVSQFFDDENLMSYRKAARAITDIGLGEHFFALVIIFFFIFRARENSAGSELNDELKKHWLWMKTWCLDFFMALFFSGLTGEIIKISLGRQRPHVSDTFEPHVFLPFTFQSHYHSMPSGHSQVLFCVATMLAILWPRRRWFFYLLALALITTRVIVQAHFLSDVLMGALVGNLGTLWTLYILQAHWPQKFSLRR
jgi:membrane-associated phospholipid phosphatase